ncbi:hypothetical protein Tco_0448095 [Tanacetum coccineum]
MRMRSPLGVGCFPEGKPLVVARKGRPKMIGTSSSSSISKTTKSTRKMNLLTFTNRFSQTPIGFMLAPRTARAFLTARGLDKIWQCEASWIPFCLGKGRLDDLEGPSFLISPSKRLSDIGRGGAGKGGSWVLGNGYL